MSLYTFIHNLLNLLVQIANKIGLQEMKKNQNVRNRKWLIKSVDIYAISYTLILKIRD
jgi:hypothetical protein